MGAVLLQVDVAGLDRPVAYSSKKLNKHQKEALGLVLAIKHFEVYLSHSGWEVTVYTDHNLLLFQARSKTSNPRVFQWALVLQPFSLVMQHVAGKNNVLACLPVGEPN